MNDITAAEEVKTHPDTVKMGILGCVQGPPFLYPDKQEVGTEHATHPQLSMCKLVLRISFTILILTV